MQSRRRTTLAIAADAIARGDIIARGGGNYFVRKEQAGRRVLRKDTYLKKYLVVLVAGVMVLASLAPQIITGFGSLEDAQEACRTNFKQVVRQRVEAMDMTESEEADFISTVEPQKQNFLMPSYVLNAAAAICSVACLNMWMVFGSQIASSEVYDQRRTYHIYRFSLSAMHSHRTSYLVRTLREVDASALISLVPPANKVGSFYVFQVLGSIGTLAAQAINVCASSLNIFRVASALHVSFVALSTIVTNILCHRVLLVKAKAISTT